MSVSFLDKIPAFAATYPSAILIVEWSPTADLTDVDGSGWTWVDITSDVLQADGKTIQISPMGKSEAAAVAQPAGCAFTLDNTSGNYSRGPQSTYYPNVKMNVPIRVSISLNGNPAAKVVRFQGYAYSLQPHWDETGRYSVVDVHAAGITRRLQHGVPALRSPLFRAFTNDSAVVAYWPMEDGVGSTSFGSAISGMPDLTFSGLTLADYSGISGSEPLPEFTASGSHWLYFVQ